MGSERQTAQSCARACHDRAAGDAIGRQRSRAAAAGARACCNRAGGSRAGGARVGGARAGIASAGGAWDCGLAGAGMGEREKDQ
jgi:hypothetical protein